MPYWKTLFGNKKEYTETVSKEALAYISEALQIIESKVHIEADLVSVASID